jgi:small subunit ribosomal protein S20
MANTSSAQKAARKTVRRAAINKNRRTRTRTSVRKVEEALATGDKTAALLAMRAAEPELMRTAQKGLIHKNAAARKVSRLTSRINKLSATA